MVSAHFQGLQALKIYTNESELGWGATDGYLPIGGRWDANEQSRINFLELKTLFFALNKYFESWKSSRHIRIKSENTTVISIFEHYGGKMSVKCNILPKKIWDLCNEHGCWISADDIPSFYNTVANYISRTINESTE